ALVAEVPLLWWSVALPLNQSSWLQMQEAVTVQEGLCVLVSCSFSYPEGGWKHSTPTYGSWYKTKKNSKPDPENNNLVATNNPHKEAKGKNKLHFRLLGDPQANDCSLSISEVRKDDSGTYYFHLEPGAVNHTYESNLLTLTVTELTQTPDIRIQEPLQSGHLSHVTCSMPGACDWPTAPRISWAGAALRAAGSGLEPSTSEILLTPHPEDHGTYLSCRVAFPRAGVSSNRTVQLNVSYAPQNLTISISGAGDPGRRGVPLGLGGDRCLPKGQFLRLLCAADSHPPATLSWVLEDRVLSWSCPLGPRTLELELPVVKPGDSGLYTCRAENRLGSQQGTLDLSVQCECVQKVPGRGAEEGQGPRQALRWLSVPVSSFRLKTCRKKAASPTGTAHQDAPVDLGPVCGVSEGPPVLQPPLPRWLGQNLWTAWGLIVANRLCSWVPSNTAPVPV
uniref:Ig-like domain-containing protein n=1 Tax=Spermophilus dauricus TaxID=99837 RepID=A0A8C9PYX8_SPEDA